MASFYDMFKPQPTNATPAPSPSPAPSPTPGPTGTPAPSPSPTNSPMPGTKQEPVNPLDAYAKLWDTTPNPDAPTAPTFTIDPKVMQQAASQQDFSKSVPPELMARVQAGEAAAIVEMVNHVGQQAYLASLSHTTNLTDKYVDARLKFDATNRSKEVKAELTNAALSNSPNFQHPVLKAELKRVADAMQSQNPDASPEQIVESAKKYVTDIYSAMNPEAKPDPSKDEVTGGTDWDKWLQS